MFQSNVIDTNSKGSRFFKTYSNTKIGNGRLNRKFINIDSFRNNVRYIELSKKRQFIKIVEDISKLDDNWNLNGSKPFSDYLIKKCKTVLNNLNNVYDLEIFPTARESIQFEIELNDRYLEFEIFSDKITVFFIDENDKEEEIEVDNVTTLNNYIKKIYE